MNVWLAVGAGGAIGSMLRYGLTAVTQRVTGAAFPIGTLLVNTAGGLVAGLLYVWLIERGDPRPELRSFLLIGVLGGFTTFSAFSVDTVVLMMQRSYGQAALNVVGSVVLCVTGAALGMALGRQT